MGILTRQVSVEATPDHPILNLKPQKDQQRGEGSAADASR
jgi:hypothetical protein